MDKSPVLIIGGYGDVGFRLAKILTSRCNTPMILAGRNRLSAENAAAKLGYLARGIGLNAEMGIPLNLIKSVKAIVNLSEIAGDRIAKECVEADKIYIDASASHKYLLKIKKTVEQLGAVKGLAVINAGLAPGLTNIMAADILNRHQCSKDIDIVVSLGGGVRHGLAATQWFLESLGEQFQTRRDRINQKIVTGDHWKIFSSSFFQQEKVWAMAFGLPDQIAIADKYPQLENARSFLNLEPVWLNTFLRTTMTNGISKLISKYAHFFANLLQRIPEFGNDNVFIYIQVRSKNGDETHISAFRGTDQAELTANMLVAGLLCAEDSSKTGVVDLDDILDLKRSKAALAEGDVSAHAFQTPRFMEIST